MTSFHWRAFARNNTAVAVLNAVLLWGGHSWKSPSVMARLRVMQKTFLWKQACLQLSVVWLIVELAERRATYVADQRCADRIIFPVDKPSLFLQ